MNLTKLINFLDSRYNAPKVPTVNTWYNKVYDILGYILFISLLLTIIYLTLIYNSAQ